MTRAAQIGTFCTLMGRCADGIRWSACWQVQDPCGWPEAGLMGMGGWPAWKVAHVADSYRHSVAGLCSAGGWPGVPLG